jgi:hypothetical protein
MNQTRLYVIFGRLFVAIVRLLNGLRGGPSDWQTMKEQSRKEKKINNQRQHTGWLNDEATYTHCVPKIFPRLEWQRH